MFTRLDEDIFFTSFPKAAFSPHTYFAKQKELLCLKIVKYIVSLFIYIYIYIQVQGYQ